MVPEVSVIVMQLVEYNVEMTLSPLESPSTKSLNEGLSTVGAATKMQAKGGTELASEIN